MRLNKKLQEYYNRNQRLSPLMQRLHSFHKKIYLYLIGTTSGQSERIDIYNEYIKIIQFGYFKNQEEIAANKFNAIKQLSDIILHREELSSNSFIILNNKDHLIILRKYFLHLIQKSKENQFLEKDEFIEELDSFRSEMRKYKIDVFKESKLRLKDKIRFLREPQHKLNYNKSTKLKDKYDYRN